MTQLLTVLERFYDAVPRDRADAVRIGPFVLFVPRGASHPFYARPFEENGDVTVTDIHAVRERQRALGLPEAFEWVHDLSPRLVDVVERAGLSVLRAPLMVQDEYVPPAAGVPVKILDPDDPDFAADVALRRAIAHVGFSAAGTAVGTEGPAERDAGIVPPTADELALETRRMRAGSVAGALAGDGWGASGAVQRVDDVAEIVGVATLPSARRQGLGAAVTAALAGWARDAGAGIVFLSAGSEVIARVYERAGFRRVGTSCIAEP